MAPAKGNREKTIRMFADKRLGELFAQLLSKQNFAELLFAKEFVHSIRALYILSVVGNLGNRAWDEALAPLNFAGTTPRQSSNSEFFLLQRFPDSTFHDLTDLLHLTQTI